MIQSLIRWKLLEIYEMIRLTRVYLDSNIIIAKIAGFENNSNQACGKQPSQLKVIIIPLERQCYNGYEWIFSHVISTK